MSPRLTTIKRLFGLCSNRCAFPGCTVEMIHESEVVLAEMAHICAQSPNGPRYDEHQSAEERDSFENLILLCGSHHTLIDAETNLSTYTVQVLRAMKAQHEERASKGSTISDWTAQVLGLGRPNRWTPPAVAELAPTPAVLVEGTFVVRYRHAHGNPSVIAGKLERDKRTGRWTIRPPGSRQIPIGEETVLGPPESFDFRDRAGADAVLSMVQWAREGYTIHPECFKSWMPQYWRAFGYQPPQPQLW